MLVYNAYSFILTMKWNWVYFFKLLIKILHFIAAHFQYNGYYD